MKGSSGDTLPVIQFIGVDRTTSEGEIREVRQHNLDKLLLGKGSRHLFFLREQDSSNDYWLGTAEPYRFLLKGEQAKAESPNGDLDGAFPDRSEADLIGQVETLIAGRS